MLVLFLKTHHNHGNIGKCTASIFSVRLPCETSILYGRNRQRAQQSWILRLAYLLQSIHKVKEGHVIAFSLCPSSTLLCFRHTITLILRYADKRIANITKGQIKRNNSQLELIRYRFFLLYSRSRDGFNAQSGYEIVLVLLGLMSSNPTLQTARLSCNVLNFILLDLLQMSTTK